ncbi:hypothetical protein EVAR_63824_1 [Eumeta japonica]|uniref:Uncharacterized protein n=1 Tax=Eumeta variegata TaxID=151549 RepID=A0A4C1ZMX8_EUMVA|nr:hypothetical protein EVAR_63824_1 [Eumeta japonica]
MELEPSSKIKPEAGLDRDDPLYLSMCLFIRSIFGRAEQSTIPFLLEADEFLHELGGFEAKQSSSHFRTSSNFVYCWSLSSLKKASGENTPDAR